MTWLDQLVAARSRMRDVRVAEPPDGYMMEFVGVGGTVHPGYESPGFWFLACCRCGAMVYDYVAHDGWHK